MKRLTKPRKMIIDALNLLHHATFDEILEYLTKENINISLSSFYRNISFLEKDQVIRKVDSSFNKEIYELCNLPLHNHFICDKCNKVYDVKKDEFKSYCDSNGNLIKEENINFYGTCRSCLEKEKSN